MALAHVGAARRIEALATESRAQERLLARLGPKTRLASTRAELAGLVSAL